MSQERTLVLVKPDGVQRGLIGEVIGRLERRGLQLVGLKLMQMDDALAARHYAEHVEKPFYGGLREFMTSGPLVAAVFAGENAVQAARQSMGATNPLESSPGSIRGDFALDIGRNVVHGSDSAESGEREVALFFRPEELLALLTWAFLLAGLASLLSVIAVPEIGTARYSDAWRGVLGHKNDTGRILRPKYPGPALL